MAKSFIALLLGYITVLFCVMLVDNSVMFLTHHETLESIVKAMPAFLYARLASSLIFTLISAYVIMRYTKKKELRLPFIYGLLLTVVGMGQMACQPEYIPAWWHVFNVLFTLPAVLVGAFFYLKK